MSVTEIHEEKNTFQVDVNIPGHDPRVTTPLFRKSRLHLLERDGARCWTCGATAAEAGHPLEAHHYPIERSFAEMIDWSPGSLIRREFPMFGWGSFEGDWVDIDGVQVWIPKDPYIFVDDMNVNGRLLCKAHHTGKDEGVHDLPEPVWLAQRYGRIGFDFSKVEIIHHYDQEDIMHKVPDEEGAAAVEGLQEEPAEVVNETQSEIAIGDDPPTK